MTALALNGFNIGSDLSVVISNDAGDVFPATDLGLLEMVEATVDTEILKVTAITRGGKPLYQSIPNGVSGSMRFTRANGSLFSIFVILQQAFYTAGILPQWTITCTVLNRDGTTDEYMFEGVVFGKPQFGSFDEIKEVKQTFDFNAQQITSTTALPSAAGKLAAAI